MRIRRGQGEDAAKLTRLERLSKASWGYPEAWLDEWESELEISAEYIQQNSVFVAESQGCLIGVVGVGEGPEGPEIVHLWISPGSQGLGLGRMLVDRARDVVILPARSPFRCHQTTSWRSFTGWLKLHRRPALTQ